MCFIIIEKKCGGINLFVSINESGKHIQWNTEI